MGRKTNEIEKQAPKEEPKNGGRREKIELACSEVGDDFKNLGEIA